MIIIGAGMSGLLCGALNPGSKIYEAGPEKESNHQALFRCKTNQIGKVLGINFKKVLVYKSIWLDDTEVHSTPRIAHMYSQKVAGKISGRSIVNIESGTRYIPPLDFISQLKLRCNIKYGVKFNYEDKLEYEFPIVSTIPLPNMLSMLNFQNNIIYYGHKPIYVERITIPDCDSYCTVYYPDPSFSAYRASITGNILIIEGMRKIQSCDVETVRQSLGLPYDKFPTVNKFKNSTQSMGKILPIDNKFREKAIVELTMKYGVYSLGRFATWRPKVLLDDVLEDIWHIRKLIEGGNYAAMLKGIE